MLIDYYKFNIHNSNSKNNLSILHLLNNLSQITPIYRIKLNTGNSEFYLYPFLLIWQSSLNFNFGGMYFYSANLLQSISAKKICFFKIAILLWPNLA